MTKEAIFDKASRLGQRKVRVRVPARVAYDLDSFQKVIANLAEELGCLPCISGADCTFELNSDWVVNPAGKLEQPGFRG